MEGLCGPGVRLGHSGARLVSFGSELKIDYPCPLTAVVSSTATSISCYSPFLQCGDQQLAKLRAQTRVSIDPIVSANLSNPPPAPLGNRRRFGPAPEEAAPPQLAKPSPSAYPRPQPQNDRESSRSDRETPPANGAGKYEDVCGGLIMSCSCPSALTVW